MPKYTQEEITEERWYRGRLDYKLHAGQKLLKEKLLTCKKQLFVTECSRQFGKSYFWVAYILEFAHKNPNSKIKLGTAFYTDLIEFIMPAFEAVMEDCPEYLRAKFRTSGTKFICHNGSEIKLVGLDRNPNGLRGNVIDLIVLDEAGFITNLDYLYKSVIMPATTHRPNCKVVFSSSAPSTPAHPFLDYVQKADLEDAYCKMTIYQNPMVTPETIERLMAESGGKESTTWRREYLCEHVTDSDLAVVSEWKQEYVQEIERDVYFPFYHKYQAMDLGVKDKTVNLYAYYDFIKAKLIILDEYVIHGPSMNTQKLADGLNTQQKQVFGDYPSYLKISDNNNPLLLQDLSLLHGIHFIPTDKGRLHEMVNAVKIMVGKGDILVHPRCKQLIGCLEFGVWDKNRVGFDRSKHYGHYDALAALVYLVRNLNRHENPIPVGFGYDSSEAFITNHRKQPTWKNAFGVKT